MYVGLISTYINNKCLLFRVHNPGVDYEVPQMTFVYIGGIEQYHYATFVDKRQSFLMVIPFGLLSASLPGDIKIDMPSGLVPEKLRIFMSPLELIVGELNVIP